MSFLRRDPVPPPEPPRPSTVVGEAATPDACAQDYQQRSNTAAPHPGSFTAQPHTHR